MQKLIPAVDRLLSILELLANEQGELSFSELSSSLNIPKPSMNFHRGFDEWSWIRGQEHDPYRSDPYPSREEIERYVPQNLREGERIGRKVYRFHR